MKGLGSELSGYLRSSVRQSVDPPVRPFIRPSVRPSIHPSIHPCQFIHSYISLIFIRFFTYFMLVSLDLIKMFLCFEITTKKTTTKKKTKKHTHKHVIHIVVFMLVESNTSPCTVNMRIHVSSIYIQLLVRSRKVFTCHFDIW